jgi:hypothetical protein
MYYLWEDNMRTIFVGMMVGASLLFSGIAVAEQPDGGTGISSEEMAEARQQLVTLSAMLGVIPPVVDAGQPVEHKTMADVADKALDRAMNMASGVVVSLSKTLESVAPHVWRIMVVQQYAKAATNIIFPLSFVLLFSFLMLVRAKMWKRPNQNESSYWSDSYAAWFWVGNLLPMFCLSCSFLWLGANFADSVSYVINPEYYAIRDLLQMVLNPGSIK